MTRRPLRALLFLLVALASLPAHAQSDRKRSVAPGDPRAVYIVVLNGEKGAEPEFDKGGAKLLGRWSNRVVVELPPAAVEAMLTHGRVKYVQHLLTGPVTAESATSPERSSARFVPKALTGGGTLQWSTGNYHYDGSGNIDRIDTDSSGQTRRFVYDEVNRLVEAGLEAPMAMPGTYTNYARYTYDSFGNRLSEATPTMNETVTADRNTNRVTLTGTVVTYDGVGNMTQGGGLMYQYDPFNNLKEVDNWYAVQKMAIYNADDERIIFCGDGSSGPCRWTLRGNDSEVLREYESGPIGNGNFWSFYLWVEDYVYRGSLLAGAQRETAEGGRLYFHLDHLGSPRLTTNAAGQKVTANEFAPFGRELTSITQETQLGYNRTETLRFTGHERDFVEGTGSDTVNFIDYMHARSYTSVFGRFLSVDPELGSAGRPQSWNRYAYVMNNPINAIDPSGDCETKPGDRIPCSDMEITVEAKTPTPLEQALSNAMDVALDTVDMTVFDSVKPALMVMDSFRTDNMKEFALGTGGLVLSGAFGGATSALTRPAATVGVTLLDNLAIDASETAAVSETTALVSTSRAITSHGADAMTEHGVTRAMVEKAVEVGEKFYDPKNSSVVYVIRRGMASGKDLAVAIDPFTGTVKTVMVNLKAVRPRFIPLP